MSTLAEVVLSAHRPVSIAEGFKICSVFLDSLLSFDAMFLNNIIYNILKSDEALNLNMSCNLAFHLQ